MKRRAVAAIELEIKRLRKALVPMTRGTRGITFSDVKRACRALGIGNKAK
jgi:hypothetical protein